MKRLLNKITDMLADAALLEMGVAVGPTEVHGYEVAAESRIGMLKRFFHHFSVTMADAALLEIGLPTVRSAEQRGDVSETIEENLIEVAFAEAADYDDIHKAILKERWSERDIVHPDECQYGDNDMCFV